MQAAARRDKDNVLWSLGILQTHESFFRGQTGIQFTINLGKNLE